MQAMSQLVDYENSQVPSHGSLIARPHVSTEKCSLVAWERALVPVVSSCNSTYSMEGGLWTAI